MCNLLAGCVRTCHLITMNVDTQIYNKRLHDTDKYDIEHTYSITENLVLNELCSNLLGVHFALQYCINNRLYKLHKIQH